MEPEAALHEPTDRRDFEVGERSGTEDAMAGLRDANLEVEKAFGALHDKIGPLIIESERDSAATTLVGVRPEYSPFAGRIYDEVDRLNHTARLIRSITARIDL